MNAVQMLSIPNRTWGTVWRSSREVPELNRTSTTLAGAALRVRRDTNATPALGTAIGSGPGRCVVAPSVGTRQLTCGVKSGKHLWAQI